MERHLMELPSKSLLVEQVKGYKVSHTRHTGRNQRVTLSLCIKIDQAMAAAAAHYALGIPLSAPGPLRSAEDSDDE